MKWTVNFKKRDFDGWVMTPGVTFDVEELSWKAQGGPEKGRVIARAASLERLWGLADLLRCRTDIQDEKGQAWWGYVRGVEVHDGARVMRVSLDNVWNKICVMYRLPGPTEGGEEHFTDWGENSESEAMFGRRERIFGMGQATLEAAMGYRSVLLARYGQPAVECGIEPGAAEGEQYAVIELAGWWETLDWEYYHQERGRVGNLEGGASQVFGTSAVQKIRQSFSLSSGTWQLKEIWLKLRKELATDGVIVQVLTTGGVELASRTVDSADISDNQDWVKFELSAEVTVTAGTTYRLEVSRSGSLSDTAYYTVGVDEGLSYAGFSLWYYTGSGWASRVPDADLTFLGLGEEDTGTQIADMIEAGQYAGSAYRVGASGISGRLYRDGSERIRAEVEKLLEVGNSDGERLLGWAGRHRAFYVRAVSEEVKWKIGSDGSICLKDGRKAYPSDQVEGEWANLGEGAAAGELLGYEGKVFIERCVWQGGRLRVG